MMHSMNDDPKSSPPQSNPQPGGREEALFEQALELPADRRNAFLEAACGADIPLRDRLTHLLRSHDQAGDFLEPNTAPAGTTQTIPITIDPREKAGDFIGRYKLRELLGEGGCGVVYVAEQTQPVRRRVALKVIKLGMDTASVIARFEAERQALAMMDHPNIAKVLDAGSTATGRPYFVMELVRGIKITNYCDQNQLSTRQRLELFIQVCHAVQHAHQKGIIHRDLKPSNILVTMHDGVPVPKVIDFGIAKATEGRLTDLTVYTELHQFIGTPAYMSPEQAEMSALDVDTRTDIYSLGVLLYELLTGKTPLDINDLARAGVDAMRRTIREQEPPRPSTRLSTMLAADLTAVAKRHGAEPPKLIHLIRGDLDWIVMKALEKDRTRRFPTANDLANDTQRYLRNEPVEARPPGKFYRIQKTVQRNKTAFVAGAIVAATLVVALAVSIHLYIKENQAYRRALAAEKQEAALRQQAEAGLALERKLRAMAPIMEQLSAAGNFVSQGKSAEAEEIMEHVPPLAESAIVYNALGFVHTRKSEWTAAVLSYSNAIAVQPTNSLAYHCMAPLLARIRDTAAYGAHRTATLARFSTTADPAIAAQVAADCLILPAQSMEMQTIRRLADAAILAGPTHPSWPFIVWAKGLSEYRDGQFAAAIAHLRQALGPQSSPALAVAANAVLAMAQHQLGQTAEARTTLRDAAKFGPASDPLPVSLTENDEMTANLLLQEARALIQNPANSATPAGERL
ncbi:MAG TPA: serine/threonine-protein kinase [Verrucomicrobiae bacterium]|nr:serine/threonine-protein kinase [Verrucomicrobiae bacterium]